MKLKALNIRIPAEVYDEIKLIGIVEDKSMKEIIIEAIKHYSKKNTFKKEMKNLKHRIYKLKYDSYEKDKQ
jgi:hypothetical protein